MKSVTKEQLAAMDADSDRCATELSDAEVDVLGYACLVAIMSQGNGYHRLAEQRLQKRTIDNGCSATVITSAGALIYGLNALSAKRICLVTPYMPSLTKLVVEYIESEGIEVIDYLGLGIENNIEVGERDPMALVEIYKRLSLKSADALVLSACVQMPSLAAIQPVQDECGIPVISAAVSTAYQMMKALDLQATVPGVGELLSGKY